MNFFALEQAKDKFTNNGDALLVRTEYIQAVYRRKDSTFILVGNEEFEIKTTVEKLAQMMCEQQTVRIGRL